MSTWGRPKILEDSRYLSIKVSSVMFFELKELAKAKDVSVSSLVRQAITLLFEKENRK